MIYKIWSAKLFTLNMGQRYVPLFCNTGHREVRELCPLYIVTPVIVIWVTENCAPCIYNMGHRELCPLYIVTYVCNMGHRELCPLYIVILDIIVCSCHTATGRYQQEYT